VRRKLLDERTYRVVVYIHNSIQIWACSFRMMNVRIFHTVVRPHSPSFARWTRDRLRPSVTQCSRKYATHRDPLPSSLLTSALDQKQRGPQRDESVGPFQLGMQPSIRHGEKVKKWSELSTGGKGIVGLRFPALICDTDRTLGQSPEQLHDQRT